MYLRITNLHLIVSFLVLSAVGLFLYFLHFRQRPALVVERPPVTELPDHEALLREEERRQEEARLRQEAMDRAQRSLSRAAQTIESARGEGKDVQLPSKTYQQAREIFFQAQTVDDFYRAQTLAEQALQQALAVPSSRLKTYVVKRGDNLWRIAKKKEVYGRGAGWVKIWRANEKKVSDFDLLYVGISLAIPE
jgi:nucleoid-associated protein YgaU